MLAGMSQSDLIRAYVVENYIEPARRRQDTFVHVVAGDVHRALKLSQEIPLVCAALRSEQFLVSNGLELEKLDGPSSGQGEKVTFTYRLNEHGESLKDARLAAIDSIYGVGKGIFAGLGGGEAFIRSQRENFFGPDKTR
jgi:hypothetical protein